MGDMETVMALWALLVVVQLYAMWRIKRPPLSLQIAFLAGLPGVVLLVLFYSLAVHMHASLNGWPMSIGEREFSPLLILHDQIAFHYFELMVLGSFLIWPMAFLLCLLVSFLRRYVFYLGVYILSMVFAFGLMLCAPSPFLNWWWD